LAGCRFRRAAAPARIWPGALALLLTPARQQFHIVKHLHNKALIYGTAPDYAVMTEARALPTRKGCDT
jgi:hypothetical protein